MLCQYPSDAERFVRLGLDKASVHVTGSIKFDIEVSTEQVSKGKALREQIGFDRCVWIAASTHQGEDEIILDAHKQLLKGNPNTLLMIVPRHPERFNQVMELAKQHQFNTITERVSNQSPLMLKCILRIRWAKCWYYSAALMSVLWAEVLLEIKLEGIIC